MISNGTNQHRTGNEAIAQHILINAVSVRQNPDWPSSLEKVPAYASASVQLSCPACTHVKNELSLLCCYGGNDASARLISLCVMQPTKRHLSARQLLKLAVMQLLKASGGLLGSALKASDLRDPPATGRAAIADVLSWSSELSRAVDPLLSWHVLACNSSAKYGLPACQGINLVDIPPQTFGQGRSPKMH